MEPKYGIKILDRELACAPFDSPEGRDYFAAMKCGLNMSFANRQVILHRIREVFSEIFGRSAEDLEMRVVYDVSHNTAKLERTSVDGKEKDIARASQRLDARVRSGARRLARALSRDGPAGDSSAAAWRPAPICSWAHLQAQKHSSAQRTGAAAR
jgi:RNA-splicing ligase RtcB